MGSSRQMIPTWTDLKIGCICEMPFVMVEIVP